MKIFIKSLMLLALAFSASCQSTTEKPPMSTEPNTTPKEIVEAPKTIEQTPAAATLPQKWEGEYLFVNNGKQEGNNQIGNDFELLLGAESSLHIVAHSMSSPHARLVLDPKLDAKENLAVYVKETDYFSDLDDKKFSYLKAGDLLFVLSKKGANLSIKWETLTPLYGKVSGGVFEKQE